MKAKEILESIKPYMNRARIFDLIARAIDELDLKDTAQVAAALGVKKGTVNTRATYHDIGWKIAPRATVYSPSDVEELRKLIFEYKGQQPATLAMIGGMRVMREEGKTLAAIGKEFGKTESYVSKLLKDKK